MKYFFDDRQRQRDLFRIAEEWLYTPYRHRTGVKGLGADCIQFVGRVLEEVGALKWRRDLIPDYPRDWHLHHTDELLLDSIEKELNVERIYEPGSEKFNAKKLKNGDIILYKFGRASAHAGILFRDKVYQAITDIGVRKIHLMDPLWVKRVSYILRIKA